MQVKFANRASNKTGQIKSISKYEMLYMPNSIATKKRISEKRTNITPHDVSDFNGSGLCYGRSVQPMCNWQMPLNSRHSIKRRDIIHKVSRIFVTFVVCLWWFGSIGFVHGGDSVSHVLHINESIKSTQFKWPLLITSKSHVKSATAAKTMTMVTATASKSHSSINSGTLQPLQMRQSHQSSNAHNAMNTAVYRDKIRQPLSSMFTLNVLTQEKRRKRNIDDHIVDENGSYKRHHQRQQFDISIITRSKKTNPNASFSLDLFKHTGNVQKQNTTLISLAHESNRIPDAIRESLHHHHHSVIKRFRAFVTKRYHFSAKTRDNASISTLAIVQSQIDNRTMPITESNKLNSVETTTIAATTNRVTTTTPNDGPIEPPLKHLIYILTTIVWPSKSVERGQRIREIAHKQSQLQSTNQANVNANVRSSNIFSVINRTEMFLKGLASNHKHFGDRTITSPSRSPSPSRSATVRHSNHKRSIDLPKQSKPTTKSPFDDDHFFNSKLQNYYFLYQIDNISNYNNHFDLLNSPNNYNATQIQINQQQPIQFPNHQIDNALIDATESDFLQYNSSNKLHLNNTLRYHNNKRIHLAKIASICLNCVDGINSPIKIYVLSRSLPLADATTNPLMNSKIGINHHTNRSVTFLWLAITNREKSSRSNREKRFLLPIDSNLTNGLKSYRRIADLLDNLSIGEISKSPIIQWNSSIKIGQPSQILANQLQVIIDKYDNANNRSSHQTTTLYTLIDANATLNAAHSIHAFSKSFKISNLTSNLMKASSVSGVVGTASAATTTAAAATPTNSKYNFSPISTFEHYIRIISRRNINNRKNYASKTSETSQNDGNEMKLLNFQQPLQFMQKFKRIKKQQQQIIKLFTTNHRFIHNNTLNDNNMNGTEIAVTAQMNGTNIVTNYKQNFTQSENNCTMNVLHLNESNIMNVKQSPSHMKQNQSSQPMADRLAITTNRNVKSNENDALVNNHTNANIAMKPNIQMVRSSKKVKRNERITMGQHQQSHNDNSRKSNALNSYLMRLESIKYQILMKLGLKQKPNITNTLPKHVIMETLYRADDTNAPQMNGHSRKNSHRKQHRPKQKHKQNKNHLKHDKANRPKITPTVLLNDDPNHQVYQFESHPFADNNVNSNSSDSTEDQFPFSADLFEESNDVESDDFYGRTREIIIFAEKGSYFNHQPLIEFVSTNGLDESLSSSKSVNSDTVTIPLNQTVPVNDAKLKQRSKCKGDIIENQQMRKRKRRRRRRQAFEPSNDRSTVRSKPIFLVSNDKHAVDEKVVKSTLSSTSASSTTEQYQSSEFENYPDTRVRRAFLWIKVDEIVKKKKKKKKTTTTKYEDGVIDLPKSMTNNRKLAHKSNKNRHQSKFSNFFRLWVFRIIDPISESNQQIKLSASKSVHVSKLGWQKLDVTSTVRQWYASGGKNRLRFLVDCSGCVNRFNIHLFNSKSSKKSNTRTKPNLLRNDKLNASTDPVRPFLVIYTDPHLIKRVRRHTPDCSVAVRGQCCKQKFYVSFAELGWEDWIIAPHGYYANYCQGNCNGLRTPDHFRSYHSHVIEEYRKMNRLTGLQPCCTPLKFSSMSLIYYEENQKIIKRDLPKMVVDECGCP